MNQVDPICGMEGRMAAHGEVFCSVHCLRKFEAQRGLTAADPAAIQSWNWSVVWPFLLYGGLIGILVLGTWLDALRPLAASLGDYVRLVLPPFAVGILIAAAIDILIPTALISSSLGRGGFSDVLRGSLLGFAASSCSHGCLAIGVGLYKKGASPAAFLSFLLSSSWASLPVIFLLISLFGSKGALLLALALLISLTTGAAMLMLAQHKLIETNPVFRTAPGGQWRNLLRENFNEIKGSFAKRYFGALKSLTSMTLPWIGLGLLLSSVIGTFLGHLIQSFMGKTFWGPLATMAAASVIEVCSEGSSPVALEIYKQTAALGNAFIFLEAGVITDFNEISLVWANAGRRTALAMIFVALPQALVLAYLLNWLF